MKIFHRTLFLFIKMTSSYNLTRRDNLLDPVNFGAFQKQIGTCPAGYLTVPVKPNGNCSDWKFCVPLDEKQSWAEIKQNDKPYVETRHFTSNLYKLPESMAPEQSLQNFYPPSSRRYDSRWLIKEDYFRKPIVFNGTGYEYNRSWQYPQEYALDSIVLPDEWNPFELIQRRDVQKQAIRELKERECRGMNSYTAPYLGTFYKNI